jgi:adenylosuccinate lyase
MTEYDRYLSPYTWRYASQEMRQWWSETRKRAMWRSIWVALAQAQAEFGLVQPEQVEDLRAHASEICIERALEIEAEIHHDLMAEVRAFAEQCPLGGGVIHLGATSMDIEDNADALRLRGALDILIEKLARLLRLFAEKIEANADLPILAFTHLQPAEPTTLGYRLAFYAQDLLADLENLRCLRAEIRGKGFKGAVGTAASYEELMGTQAVESFEARMSALLDLPFFPVTNQTAPRRQEYVLLTGLAALAATLSKFAFDLRLLQAPTIGEWSEPFSSKQVGSSAMPFKRNPIQSEKINSLARVLAQAPAVAWNNAAHSLLERTLDDSANRRSLLPECFLIADELLLSVTRILNGLQINPNAAARNLETYAPFASTERVLMALARAGADRQAMHERLRDHAMTAWQSVRLGGNNPLPTLLLNDPEIRRHLTVEEIQPLLDINHYVGIAPRRARELALKILAQLG